MTSTKKPGTTRHKVLRPQTRANLTDKVYNAVHAAIQAGKFKPGERVREIEIGEWLQVSRTPVREAMRRLQSDGIIEPKAGGLAVTSFDMRAVAELYAVRQILESAAAGLAAVNADQTELALLQRTLEAQQQCPNDPHAQARINKTFHEHLYQAAHNRFLLKALQVLRDSLVLLGPTTLMTSERIEAAIKEHAEVVAAVVARDSRRAEDVTRRHIRAGYEARVHSMANHLHESSD